MGHPERDMPFCVQDIKVAVPGDAGESGSSGHASAATLTHTATQVVAEILGNHQTRRIITLDTPVTTDCLELQILIPSINVPGRPLRRALPRLNPLAAAAPHSLRGAALSADHRRFFALKALLSDSASDIFPLLFRQAGDSETFRERSFRE